MQNKANMTHIPHAQRWTPLLTILLITFAVILLAPRTALSQQFTWTHKLVNSPSPRFGHAMAYDSARQVTVLFGGFTDTGVNSETWEWNGTVWTQRLVSGPSVRYGHSMVYDAARGVTVLMGGATHNPETFETWEWNGNTWTQRDVSGPSSRYLHSATYDSIRGVTVFFGGLTNTGVTSETWEWNGTTWELRSTLGPSPRYFHSMAFDTITNAVVLFGGASSGNTEVGDTWEWNGSNWTQREVTNPQARYGHAVVYHEAEGVMLLFGGQSVLPSSVIRYADIWEWNSTAWTLLNLYGPAARYGHAMAYDSARGTTVLFGGADATGYNAETWELVRPCLAPTITTQPLDQTTSPDAPVTFFVEATSGPGCITPEPLTYQWQRRNPAIIDPNEQGAWINLSDGNGFTNTRTSALVITRSTLGLATGYRCLITGGCRCATGSPPITYTDTVNFSIACPADFNADGGINGEDIQAFFERWEAGC